MLGVSQRRRTFRATTVSAAVGAALIVAEIALRIFDPPSPVQILHVNTGQLYFQDGVPVWKQTTDREHLDCALANPGRTRILIFGSSITYGYGLAANETFSALLEDRLNAARPSPGFCVMNFAQPGFGLEQSLALARTEIPKWRPALILWESWSDARMFGYTVVGNDIYDTGTTAVVRPLFDHSRLYRYLALRWAERSLGSRNERMLKDYRDLVAMSRAAGATLAIYKGTALDRPFSELTDRESPAEAESVAKEAGIPVYRLAHELEDEDYALIRLDACCHYNARGHKALAEKFERIALHELDESGR